MPNYRHTVSGKHPPLKPRNEPLAQLGEPLRSLQVSYSAQQLNHNMLADLSVPQTPHFVFALHDLTNAPRTSDTQQLESSTPSDNASESIQSRLKKLEKLREEGLLSGKEYQDKRQEILDEL